MPSLLLTVFVLQIVISVVNTIGVSTLNSLLWFLFTRIPTPTSKAVLSQRKLQREFLRQRAELNGISSQDQFAKWAKLRRQHDKTVADLEKTTNTINASKASFDQSVVLVRWTATNGLRLFLQFWYAKEALFWLPQGWLPYYVEWLLSFPRAPLGSVSIQVWGGACLAVIDLVSTALVALYSVITSWTSSGEKGEAQAFRASHSPAAGAEKVGSDPKKEL